MPWRRDCLLLPYVPHFNTFGNTSIRLVSCVKRKYFGIKSSVTICLIRTPALSQNSGVATPADARCHARAIIAVLLDAANWNQYANKEFF